jgi:hypothetical protein
LRGAIARATDRKGIDMAKGQMKKMKEAKKPKKDKAAAAKAAGATAKK